MKKRFGFIGIYYLILLLIFILQKPLFMIFNGAIGKYHIIDFIKVIYHGLSLDATTAGYLIILPFLLILISFWYDKIRLRKILFIYNVIISFIISVVFVVDASLYSFWDFKLDATIFQYLDSPKDAFASVSIGFLFLRFLLIVGLTIFYSWLLIKIIPKHFIFSNSKKSSVDSKKEGNSYYQLSLKNRIVGTILTLIIGGILFVIIRGGVTESTANVGQVYFCNDQFLNHSAVNPDFSLLSSMGKDKNFDEEFNFFDEKKREELFSGLYPTTDGDSIINVLNTKRPNVLIILMESFGSAFIEPLGGIPDVTPNFNKLSEEGIFFTNCYANSYRTDRGSISTFSGYLGLPTTSVMKLPVKSKTLPAISEQLVKEGYKTNFLYGGDINFTNYKSYLLSKGYQKITSDVDFTLAERTSNAWGVNDDITFNYLYNEIVNRKDSPWHTGFLTLSSHEPFEVPYHRLKEKIPNAFAFTDHNLGIFIEKLKKTPAWKNLLIICLPDHGFQYPKVGMRSEPRYFHMPMLWLGGAVKQPMKINKIMNQSDLAATLLGQMGIDHSKFNFSRNILGSDYKYPFAFYSYNNGFSFRDSTGVTVYDNNSNKTIFDENTKDMSNSISFEKARLEKGKAILQSVYDDLGKR